MRLAVRFAVASTTTLALAAGALGTAVPATSASTPAAAQPAASTMHWSPRPEQYPGTVTTRDIPIRMSDGVVLRADLIRPALADGTVAPGRFPVVVTITAYNKTVIAGGFGSTLGGASPLYLVKRGYAQLTVDARGTGSSEGSWCAFCTREDRDGAEVMSWAHVQPWSDGNTAMSGPSYMGIAQIFAAAGKPAGLKAIFPQVPGADVYRDIVASGGQLDVGFMPFWLGLVTVAGLVPPAVLASDPASGFSALASHLLDAGTFTAPLLLEAAAGADPAYDGPFYAQRSPINVIGDVDVPTFLVSGEFDLFQRGTPLLFENLRKRGVPTKLIIGPWDHLQGSSGAQVGDAGYGPLNELQLRWFDHYVKGMPDAALDSDIAPLTYYEQGTDTWQTSQDWVGSDRTALTFKLSGGMLLSGGALTTGTPRAGSSTVLPIPVSGLCSRSTNQWTAGAMNAFPFPNPCLSNNSLNDLTGVVFDTAPLTEPVRFQGPINAHPFTSVLGLVGDGLLSVSVEDVAPDGTVSRLTGGWQVISLRQLDTARSRYLDGTLIQPFHPYTKASQHNLTGTAPVDVEIFPTGAAIEPGHRLRLAIQAFDVPHLLPDLSLALAGLSVVTIHTGGLTPSTLTVPAVTR
jgi:putative CocE/NonD family hydrolase